MISKRDKLDFSDDMKFDHFPFSTLMISLWQLWRPLFSVIKRLISSYVSLERKIPLIYGPHWGSFNFCSNYPWSFKNARHPSSERLWNSKREAINILERVVARAVGPYLPLNWWKTLNYLFCTSCSRCPLLIHRILRYDFDQFLIHTLFFNPS